MTVIPVAYFHKDTGITGTDLHYPARSLALPPINAEDPKKKEQWFNTDLIDIFDMNKVFTTYNHNEHLRSKKILFTHLGGGIGDIIAFSSIAEFLRNKTIIVHCDPKHFPVFRWFSNQDVRLRQFYGVIMHDFTPANRVVKYATYARLRMEYAAIEAGRSNWYDAMYERIGIETPKGYSRPHLVGRSDVDSSLPKRSILISHRSSCQMRSSRFEDFYYPVINAMPEAPVYVHDIDLSDDDRKFIFSLDKQVHILPRCSIGQYLDNLYSAGMVVCTDTSAIHFREGVGKPCLAAFGAMTMESRTAGHVHTKSFNIKSSCSHQPCFIHETSKGIHCHMWEEGMNTAPCQVGESFQDQLYKELKSYK